MLTNSPMYATLPASDLDRAKRFYQDTLGFKISEERPDGFMFDSADSKYFVYGTPNAGSAQNTAACWMVSDLGAEMADLRGRGVTFEEYDFPGLKTVDGVAEDPAGGHAAWFKDTEGNILGVFQPGS